VRFEDAFSEDDVRIMKKFEEGDTVKSLAIKLSGVSDASLRKSLKNLEKLGVIVPVLEKGEARYHSTPGHRNIAVLAERCTR
jgi:predicted transcriptional regulator